MESDSKINQEMKAQLAELKRAYEQVKLKLHLAGMDVRDAWKSVEPRIDDLENRLVSAGKDAARELASSFDQLGAALKKLGAEIEKRTRDRD
ncbi:MAG TPA: hypothetical protein VNO33_02245 [Kofleriaceae bacterium]|nr:hypothetical protein [Kofleriaceae bacterium]